MMRMVQHLKVHDKVTATAVGETVIRPLESDGLNGFRGSLPAYRLSVCSNRGDDP